MALIPPFFLNCVVCIGLESASGTNWIGTGFLIGRPTGLGDSRYSTQLITNKHVLEGKTKIIVRFNSKDGSKIIDYPVDLHPQGRQVWVGHPSPLVDVAAFPINPEILNSDNAEFSFFQLDHHAMNISSMSEAGVSEGDGVFILGFPLGIVAPDNRHVIARSGIVARVRDVLAGKQQSILIDANVFPGNSGGPVILRPEAMAISGTKSTEKSDLIGIVKSFIPYQDVAISQQTGRPRVIFEENSGLAYVEPVDFILETVEKCHEANSQNP